MPDPSPTLFGVISGPDPAVAAVGVVGLELHFRSEPAVDAEFVLMLGFAGMADATFNKPVRLADGQARQMIKLNSHLLADGSHRLEAQMSARDGTVVWQAGLDLNVRNDGPLAEKVRASLRRFGTPLLVAELLDSTLYDFADNSLQPWFDRPDAKSHLAQMAQSGLISTKEAEALTGFVTDGYIAVEGVVEEDLLDQIGQELADAVDRKIEGYEYGSSQRIHNLHLFYPGIRRLWSHPRIMRLLTLIFDCEPRPCQTLSYIFGSQQDAHQDTVHLTAFPAGYMCGVWVAIDDVQPDSGELEVYPGSHRLPRIYTATVNAPKVTDGDYSELGRVIVAKWQELLQAGGFQPVVYRPKRGAVLIWHENLMHAGGQRRDMTRSRRSVVSHVFAGGAAAFGDATGLPALTTGLHDLPPLPVR